jgi:hypothetical protein
MPHTNLRLIGALLCLSAAATAAPPDPRVIFAPLTLPTPPSAVRTAGGLPGPAYWQNRADYAIAATIDPAHHTLSAHETITYTNNSPDALDVLWLQLDQNIYRQDSRAAFMPNDRAPTAAQHTDGFVIDSISVEDGQETYTPTRVQTDTRLQLRLQTRLVAKGGLLKLHIAYHYTVPGAWGGRTAFTATKNGEIYEIAQWYPRMAVYDDLRGWNTDPYLGSEFYLDYGDFDYSVTVPWNYIVAGSGSLQNPADVLTATQQARLKQASGSDTTVMIRAPSEVTDPKSRPTQSGTKTWSFHMDHTRDVAFAASPAFVWDAARANLPQGKTALAMSVYPVEAVGAQNWNRSTEYAKFALEYFSKTWFPYPWPSMVNLGGHGAGMEYPGIVFDDMHDTGKDLFWISVHEIGHSWFPMIVGSNERRHAWMDEGMNTFIDVYASNEFHNGEYAPKRDPEYAEHGGNPADEIVPTLTDPKAPAIMLPADVIGETYRHAVSYFKPAFGLVLLREQILGRDRFDPAFRRYIAAWAYKHPTPSDFFRLISSEAGENLDWFWRAWFFENEPMDLAITSAKPLDTATGTGIHLDITALDPLILPTPVELDFKSGAKKRFTLPVESFYQGDTASLNIPTSEPVASVVLDPDHALPELDRTNDAAKVSAK